MSIDSPLVPANFGTPFRAYPDNSPCRIPVLSHICRLLTARAFARIECRQFEEAIQDFDRLIELVPDDAHAYYGRGMARMELGQYPEAIADLDEAIRLDPQHPFAESARKVAAELAEGNGVEDRA